MATRQNDKAPKFGLANVPLDIFLDVVHFLDVQHILRLRRVSDDEVVLSATDA